MLAVLASSLALAGDGYADAVGKARAERVSRLERADGYLSLTASGWLEPGDTRIGSAADNDVPVPGAPAHLGVLTLAGGEVRLHLLATGGVYVDGRADTPPDIALHTQGADGSRTPTRVRFGSSYLYVVENGARRGLRVKDNDAPLRRHFPGFAYFPVDPSWRIVAKWQPFDPPESLRIAYVTGTEEDTPVPGKAVFQRDGKTYELRPIAEDGRLFFIFSDRTAGRLTYGGARFLYADAPKDGQVVLDFNLAENPPCAITPHVVCPLAPPENRLALPVTAGELKFRGAGH
ncbi:hypothetical protein ASG87_04710 [Frateuria sp. Soil773]|nr:hypothetical protein ASG87_04710 [Frateuria sp. Soil773]